MPINFTWAVRICPLLSRQALKLLPVSLLLCTNFHPKQQSCFSNQRATVIPKSKSPIHSACQSLLAIGEGEVTLGCLPQRGPYSVFCCGMGSLFPFTVVRNDMCFWYLIQMRKVGVKIVCPVSWDILGKREKKKAVIYCSVRWVECPGWCSRIVDKNSVLASLEISNIYSGSTIDIMGSCFCS